MLSLNYLLVGFRRLCQLLYRNPCFLWFQCWLETRNSVWICLNLVPKLDPKLVPKKNSKRGQNGSFNSGLLFGPNSGPNLGSNSGPNFGPNSGSDFGPNSGPTLAPNQILVVAFDCVCRSGASKETRSGAKMVPEAMRNHFAGTKVLRNTLQVSNQARESYIERSLTRIFPKCLLEVKAEKDFNILHFGLLKLHLPRLFTDTVEAPCVEAALASKFGPCFGNRNLGRNVGWRSNAQRGAFS